MSWLPRFWTPERPGFPSVWRHHWTDSEACDVREMLMMISTHSVSSGPMGSASFVNFEVPEQSGVTDPACDYRRER